MKAAGKLNLMNVGYKICIFEGGGVWGGGELEPEILLLQLSTLLALYVYENKKRKKYYATF